MTKGTFEKTVESAEYDFVLIKGLEMENVGKKITDGYCNGFAGRRYDLEGCTIEAEGKDWIVCRHPEGAPIFMDLYGWDKEEYLNRWTSETRYSE